MDTPGLDAVARRWYDGPNAKTIRRTQEGFLGMSLARQELFLIGLDIEEGILPLIYPGGRASRRIVVNDNRLIAGGGLFDYRELINAVERATAAAASAASAASGAPAASPEAARSARHVEDQPKALNALIMQDELGMANYFPQFVLWRAGQCALWRGQLRPLDVFCDEYTVVAEYQRDCTAPLRIRVEKPPLHPRAPHRYDLITLCTFYPPLGSWVRGRVHPDGYVDDLPALLRFAVTWLIRYKCWLEFNAWWPGIDVPHDPAWMVAHLAAQDYCPFHMPQRWGFCCQKDFMERARRQRALNDGILHETA
jgi:hypothetical protein